MQLFFIIKFSNNEKYDESRGSYENKYRLNRCFIIIIIILNIFLVGIEEILEIESFSRYCYKYRKT